MQRKKRYRPESDGNQRRTYEKHKKIILAEQEICALCGKPVDKSLRFPNPMSASVDHIIPIAKGGDPSALSNLQLAHLICNQVKASKLTQENNKDLIKKEEKVTNRNMPQSMHWLSYSS